MRCVLRDRRLCWLVLALALVGNQRADATGAPPGEGQPFMQHFSPRDYHAGTQCWCAAQDARGVMYVGNIGVVLEYDGVSWRKIQAGRSTVITGLAYEAATDMVFVAAQNDFGYLKIVPGGRREFVSLLDQLPPAESNFGNFSGVFATPEGVYFANGNRVRRWRDGRLRSWEWAAGVRVGCSWAADHLYIYGPQVGLVRLENDAVVSVSDDPLLRRATVRAVVTGADGALLVGTYGDGLFTLRDGTARLVEGDVGRFLKEQGIYRLLRLRDGSLAVGTVNAGLILLDAGGRFRNRVDEAGGLHGNNILGLFEDAEAGLWIGLQSGVTRAEIGSPLSILRAGSEDDLSGVIFCDDWFGSKVLGNATGLYRLVPADPTRLIGAHLERLPASTNTFASACAVTNGLLLVATGKIVLLDADAHEIPVYSQKPVARRLQPCRSQPDRVFFSDDDGRINVLRLDASTRQWAYDGVLADTGRKENNGLAVSPRGDVWLGTHSYGLLRVQPAAGKGTPVVTSFFDRPGPLQGVPTVLALYDGGPLIFDTLQKLYRLDAAGQEVRPVTEFGPRFCDGSLLCDTGMSYDEQTLWIVGKNADDPTGNRVYGRAVAGGRDRPPVFQPLPRQIEEVLGEITGYLPLDRAPDPLTGVLIAGSTGNAMVRLDVPRWEVWRTVQPSFATLIRRAVSLHKTSRAGEPPPILQDALPYRFNSVHFEFASGTLAFGAAPRFQTRLVNFGAGDWSDLTDRPAVDYLNLPEGRYTFEVRACNLDGQFGRVASVAFRVLPPWQRTPEAYAADVLALALALWGLHRWREGQMRRRNLALAALVDARTGELRGREAELVRARDDAETANRAKSAFLANMSHELRTPLNAVLGYAQIMLKHRDLPPHLREQVTVIGQSGRHLLSLINEVLDLSKIEAGKLTLSRFDFSLSQFLDEVCAAFRPRFAEKGLRFTEERDPGLPAVVCTDPSRLRQVLFNLLSNAAKFTQQGRVELLVRPGGEGHVRFEVTDTGVGIEPDERNDIFLAFHQVGATSLAAQGTGLGLAISQRLVGLLGGRIEVESAPGLGSRFWFELPLPPVMPLGGPSIAAVSDPTRGIVTGYDGAPRCLLLVDDVAENRRVLRDFLQPLGFEIEEAADGAQCVEACARRLPAGVLLDLRLGTPNGFEVARTLRARTAGASLGIIAISASVFESDREQAIAAGCDDFLPKPFEEAQLLGVLGRVLGLRWTYAARKDHEPASGEPTAVDEEDAPSREEINVLLELSLHGDIVGLRRRLDALRSGQVSAGTALLIRRLEPLVATYQMDEIHALLVEAQSHARS